MSRKQAGGNLSIKSDVCHLEKKGEGAVSVGFCVFAP